MIGEIGGTAEEQAAEWIEARLAPFLGLGLRVLGLRVLGFRA